MADTVSGSTASGAPVYASAATLGVVTGLRSVMPLALLAYAARQGTFAAGAGRPLSLLRGRAALPLLGLASLGEVVADKLPATPSRIEPGPLGGRIAFGALTGAAVCRAGGQSTIAGALLGAIGAAGGSFGGYYGRKALDGATGLPDPAVAVGEDALALGLGLLALRRDL